MSWGIFSRPILRYTGSIKELLTVFMTNRLFTSGPIHARVFQA